MEYNIKEEKWNTVSHLIGIVFAILAFPILFIKGSFTSDASQIVALIIYFVSFLFLFSASTIYHFVKDPERKAFWRKIDHISIYFMISGTYVPYMIKYIDYGTAIVFLGIMYLLVLIGSILKVWFTGKYEIASLILYIFLGWMILFIAKPFFLTASTVVILFVVLGGLAYMGGIYFYVYDKKSYYHTIWHIFVLIGSILHFQGVFIS